MPIKTGKRELIDTGSDKRFVKRNKDGTFKVGGRRPISGSRSSEQIKDCGKAGLWRPGRRARSLPKEGYEEGGKEDRKEEVAPDTSRSLIFMER